MQKYNPVDMNKIVKIESTCKLFIISAVHNFCIQLKKQTEGERIFKFVRRNNSTYVLMNHIPCDSDQTIQISSQKGVKI